MFQITYLHKQLLQYYYRHCCSRSHWHVLNFQNLNRFHFHFRNLSQSQNQSLNLNHYLPRKHHNLTRYLPRKAPD